MKTGFVWLEYRQPHKAGIITRPGEGNIKFKTFLKHRKGLSSDTWSFFVLQCDLGTMMQIWLRYLFHTMQCSAYSLDIPRDIIIVIVGPVIFKQLTA